MNAIAEIAAPDWSFWQRSLAGEKPETTPGTPFPGFYITKQYVSIPHGAKRVLTDFPVAIWFDAGKWWSRIEGLKNAWTNSDTDEVDELFGRVCRSPISHEKYKAMVATLEDWRK